MTRDDIIRIAEQCGIPEFENNESQADNIILFAEAIAASERKSYENYTAILCNTAAAYEREDCAKVADKYASIGGGFIADEIRARGGNETRRY